MFSSSTPRNLMIAFAHSSCGAILTNVLSRELWIIPDVARVIQQHVYGCRVSPNDIASRRQSDPSPYERTFNHCVVSLNRSLVESSRCLV